MSMPKVNRRHSDPLPEDEHRYFLETCKQQARCHPDPRFRALFKKACVSEELITFGVVRQLSPHIVRPE